MFGFGKTNGKRGRRNARYIDYPLIVATILLLAYGLVMLYSASYYDALRVTKLKSDLFYLKKQLLYVIGALFVIVILPRFSYRRLFRLSWLVYLVAFLAMAAVRIPFFGHQSHGSTRWLDLRIVTLQPSEFGKLAVIVAVPAVVLRLGDKIEKIWALFLLFAVVGVQAGACMVFTDNMSTAIIIALIGVAIIFIAYPKPKLLAGIIGAAAAFSALVLWVIVQLNASNNNFRLKRIFSWLSPAASRTGDGWQVTQGLYAIGNGGLLGKGFGNSTQKLGWIPEPQNDMIFSIVCEELGILGAGILIGLLVYIVFRLVFIAKNAPDLFGSLMVAGVVAHISVQSILNICVTLRVIPATGVTLPLVSYGGTALLLQVFELAIALSVSRRIRFPQGEPDREGRRRVAAAE